MQLLRRLSFTMLLMSMMTLVACGGGDITGGGDGGEGGTDGVTITVIKSDGDLSSANDVLVFATVLDDGIPVQDKTVTFSLGVDGSAILDPYSGTATTDENGIASINVKVSNEKGSVNVIASYDSATADVSFDSLGDGSVSTNPSNITVSLSLVDSDGNVTETITASKPGKITAEVDGINSPVIVTFGTTVGEIPIPTAITDDNNQASVDIFAGGTLGAGTITASVNSGETGELLLVVGSSTVNMGSGTPFEEGVAELSLEQVSAGGTSVVTVNIIDDQGELFTEAVDVNFSSGCTSLSTPTAELISPITTSNGVATSTYLATGCVGDDPINVTANAGGINLSASASINVLSADVGSIEFLSAEPEIIGIIGTGAVGGSESSIIKFRVLDTNSNPVNKQLVNFRLNTDIGDIQLIPTSATTNAEGIVQTVVNSGSVATTVRVTAEIDESSPVIASQSSLLVISTGIPDQDSFSISAETLNPEAWNYDGEEVGITARLADAFNNPVPDGTAVYFTTEGGRIEPSCVTANGTCTVTWNSQSPRPEGHVLGDANNLTHLPEVTNTMGQKYGGRVTITATVIGEESFPDTNNNGRFDASEMAAFLLTNTAGKPFDLADAFVDHNEDGVFNPTEAGGEDGGSLEELADFNSDGIFTPKDGKYNGFLCSIPAHDGCSTEKSLYVRDSLVLVMSGSHAYGAIDATVDNVSDDDLADPTKGAVNDINDNVIHLSGKNVGGASVIISDLHNQPMPAGTVIEFTATVGSIVGPNSFVWGSDNHNGGDSFSVSVKGEDEPTSGSLLVEATTPKGVSTLLSGIGIIIH